jgi:hypothetical protein
MANRSYGRSGNKQRQPHSGLFVNAPAWLEHQRIAD